MFKNINGRSGFTPSLILPLLRGIARRGGVTPSGFTLLLRRFGFAQRAGYPLQSHNANYNLLSFSLTKKKQGKDAKASLSQYVRQVFKTKRSPLAQDTVVFAQDTVVRAQDTAVCAQDTAVRAQDTAVRAQDTAVRAQDTVVRAQDTVVRAQDTAVYSHGTLVYFHLPTGNYALSEIVHNPKKLVNN